MKDKLVIIGSGGHGKVVLDAAIQQDKYEIVGFADDDIQRSEVYGYKIPGTVADFLNGKIKADCFIVAIGNNEVRKKIFEMLSGVSVAAVVIHPSAIVSASASLGAGTVVLPNSVINADVVIGMNCIVNCLCLVDHETIIGNHVHISQGTIIGSNVQIGDNISTELGDRIKSRSIIK